MSSPPGLGGRALWAGEGRWGDSKVRWGREAGPPSAWMQTFRDGGLRLPGSPLTMCSLVGYQVSWEVYGRNGSRLTHTLNSTAHEYKIRGLSSLTTYTIAVAAITAAGAGLATSSTISSGVPPGQ